MKEEISLLDSNIFNSLNIYFNELKSLFEKGLSLKISNSFIQAFQNDSNSLKKAMLVAPYYSTIYLITGIFEEMKHKENSFDPLYDTLFNQFDIQFKPTSSRNISKKDFLEILRNQFAHAHYKIIYDNETPNNTSFEIDYSDFIAKIPFSKLHEFVDVYQTSSNNIFTSASAIELPPNFNGNLNSITIEELKNLLANIKIYNIESSSVPNITELEAEQNQSNFIINFFSKVHNGKFLEYARNLEINPNFNTTQFENVPEFNTFLREYNNIKKLCDRQYRYSKRNHFEVVEKSLSENEIEFISNYLNSLDHNLLENISPNVFQATICELYRLYNEQKLTPANPKQMQYVFLHSIKKSNLDNLSPSSKNIIDLMKLTAPLNYIQTMLEQATYSIGYISQKESQIKKQNRDDSNIIDYDAIDFSKLHINPRTFSKYELEKALKDARLQRKLKEKEKQGEEKYKQQTETQLANISHRTDLDHIKTSKALQIANSQIKLSQLDTEINELTTNIDDLKKQNSKSPYNFPIIILDHLRNSIIHKRFSIVPSTLCDFAKSGNPNDLYIHFFDTDGERPTFDAKISVSDFENILQHITIISPSHEHHTLPPQSNPHDAPDDR